MALKALQPCREVGCYELTRLKRGYCEKHKHKASWHREDKKTPSQRGYGYRWRKLRAAVLERDHYSCNVCGGRANEVDHIKNKASGGTDSMINLQAICTRCHRIKTAKE